LYIYKIGSQVIGTVGDGPWAMYAALCALPTGFDELQTMMKEVGGEAGAGLDSMAAMTTFGHAYPSTPQPAMLLGHLTAVKVGPALSWQLIVAMISKTFIEGQWPAELRDSGQPDWACCSPPQKLCDQQHGIRPLDFGHLVFEAKVLQRC
jgi:hypothetical protein